MPRWGEEFELQYRELTAMELRSGVVPAASCMVDSTHERLKKTMVHPRVTTTIASQIHPSSPVILNESPCLWLDAIQRRYLAGVKEVV
ncbi:hypothetical protein IGI04_023232 [Brassica rapa subsp. trilocularis]|uniref:Uncharacterized protein n=1 Tax=Brassica rapa subsp. trilocularis TaxID=1813537 RepID=A0ABQ7M6N5_BRACM|nr:hypothetical protein IGI04_023232 [Brassica rapa subsp. trilocularis]